MSQIFWVSEWAKRRQAEVVRIPTEYKIHADFLQNRDKDDVRTAFVELNTLFQSIYGDIAFRPCEYGMPLHPKDNYRVFSTEFRAAGEAPYRPFVLLFNLLAFCEISSMSAIVDIEKYKAYKPPPKQSAKHPHLLFGKLSDHGFVFEGLSNNKRSNRNIHISYPDNPHLLSLLKQLSDKARNTDRIYDLLCGHFRLLQDDMQTANYGHGANDVADRVHTDTDKKIVLSLDRILKDKGFVSKPYGGIECYGVAYYHNEKDMNSKKPYSYRVVTRGMDFEHPDTDTEKMILQLRIRNVEKCLQFLTSCPDSVKRIFTNHTDLGCPKRLNDTCKHGISYEIDGKLHWRCACCHTPFSVKPNIRDIPHYIKLVDLGEKK